MIKLFISTVQITVSNHVISSGLMEWYRYKVNLPLVPPRISYGVL